MHMTEPLTLTIAGDKAAHSCVFAQKTDHAKAVNTYTLQFTLRADQHATINLTFDPPPTTQQPQLFPTPPMPQVEPPVTPSSKRPRSTKS